MQAMLRLESETVDFGDVRVGDLRDSLVRVMLRNTGSAPITLSSARVIGPDTSQFALLDEAESLTVPGRGVRAVMLRFAPDRSGRASGRIAFGYDGAGSPLLAQMFGLGVGGDDESLDAPGEPYTDPTAFRTITLPNGTVPPKGTIATGVYDLFGLMAGYVPIDNLMILAGGALPFPDDWGGVSGTMYGVYSVGARWSVSPVPRVHMAFGYQWGRSLYDEESTPGVVDSRITVNVPYAAFSYGDNDSRVSATIAYAFKRHMTPAGTFSKDAVMLGLGGDYRFADRWKIAAEALTMQTLGYLPVALTFRFFGHRYAIDAGIGYLGITTAGGKAPSPSLVPVVSFVVVW